MILREIYVENFKSLKECRIKLGKFNVVVGPNASGKSNLVEIFKLLKKIYVERADNPFTEWWGYRNVVSDHKEELPIKIQLKFEDEKDKKNKNEILFEVEISGTGGHFEIVKEIFEVNGLRIEKTYKDKVKINYENNGKTDTIEFEYESDLLNPIFGYETILESKDENFRNTLTIYKRKKDEKYKEYEETLKQPILPKKKQDYNTLEERIIKIGGMLNKQYNRYSKLDKIKSDIDIINEKCNVLENLLKTHVNALRYTGKIVDFIKNNVILKDINITEIKPPINPTKNITLSEDGRNIVNVLYNLFLENGQVPDGIKTLLSYIFPNTTIKFKLTDDGRILMEISENDLVLLPPSISVGFFKFLTIITALELKPALIVIDELENSLYPKAIDLLMDEFKNSESQVIITTHSPVVVDLVYPDINDLILVKKENGESSFINIEDEEKIRYELDESGITLSEKWLYGKIDIIL